MSDDRLTVGVLGPMEVHLGDRPVRLTAGRLRTLLAVLALSPSEAVPLARLAHAIWDGERPVDPRASIQLYVTRLRAQLGRDLIVSGADAYALRVAADDVDATRFVRLLEQCSSPVPPERARLDAALALWRGMPFEDVRSGWLRDSQAPRLVEAYLWAVERRVDLASAESGGAELVPMLRDLTSRYPSRESLWVRLLTVLDRCGRPAEALEAYESIRRRLSDELGVDPGPQLQALYTVLLTHTAARHPAVPATPRHLPAAIEGFAGRAAILDTLNELEGRGRTVVVAISGTAGVGKTTLAVHWAHRVADRFPDGQLFVNLRGFDPIGPPVPAVEAVRGFLDALHVPAKRIPAAVDQQITLYRSLLAGKRVLVVLDNARDADQVIPLLPGAPECLVVVTSRTDLSALVARHTAYPIVLQPPTDTEARQMLIHRLGPDRIAAEPAAAQQIISDCARLPLAVAIVAARAAAHPEFPLDTLATELRTANRLDALTSDNPGTDLRTVLSWSYQTLPGDTAQLFRLLGLHPGPDIGQPAAASLLGLPPAQAAAALRELTRAHLVTEHQPGRYTLHDLLRGYATELATTHDTEATRRAARQRLLDHYLHTAYTAAELLHPPRDPITLDPAPADIVTEDLTDRAAATTWFTREHRVLIAVIEQAADRGFDIHAWQLAWTVVDFLNRHGHVHDLVTVQRTALEATRRLANTTEHVRAHRTLARAVARLDQIRSAHAHLQQAMTIANETGDRSALAHIHRDLGWLLGRQHQDRQALRHNEQALQIFHTIGHDAGHVDALCAVGTTHAKLGHHQQAITFCEQALDLAGHTEHHPVTANAWHSLGYAHHNLGHHARAATCYRRAIDLFRDLGDGPNEADSLSRLGDTYHAAGDTSDAWASWRQALDILDELDHQEAADRVRVKLDAAAVRG